MQVFLPKRTINLKVSRAALVLPIIVIILVSLVWWRLGIIFEESIMDHKIAALQSSLDRTATILTSNVNRRQAILIGMAASVKTHSIEDLRDQHFLQFASGLQANDPVIRVIQFYPADGKNMVYPLEGNEAVVDRTLHDLIYDERANVRTDVNRTIESRQITLSSPYELRQGGRGVVARLAVFDESDEFLGLVVVILDLEPLLEIPGLSPAPDDVQIAIKDLQDQVFFGNETVFSSTPVLSSVILPEGSWVLGAAPLPIWYADVQTQMVFFWLVGGLLVLMSGGIVYLTSSRHSSLERTVAERTAALAESEQRYITTLKVVNEGIWDWDLNNDKWFSSEQTSSMLGYGENTFQSWNDLFEITHPEDLPRMKEEVGKGIESGLGFDTETRLRNNNEEWMYILLRGRMVNSEPNGKASRMVGTAEDITKRKLAEEQLREGEAKFRALFENNHAIMMLFDPTSGIIMDANPAACAFYGWNHTELTSKNINQINTLTDDEIKKAMENAANENRHFFQFQHRLANDEFRDVEVYSGPIQHKGKKLLYSIIYDISARKRSERALEDSESRYRQLLQLAPIGIAVHSGGIILYSNPYGARLLGAETPDQIIGKPLMDFIHPDGIEKTQNRIRRFVSGETGLYPAEDVYRKLDGAALNVEVMVAPLEFEGKPAFQVIFSDISDRKKDEEKILKVQKELEQLLSEADESRRVLLSVIEDQNIAEEKLSRLNTELEQRVYERTIQLEAANKELEAFSYSVSHDLRSPLRGIDGWSLALLEDYGDQLDAKGHMYLERVRNETQRMGQLIDDLLRLSRVTRQEMKTMVVNLSDLAQMISVQLQEENAQTPAEFVIQPGIITTGDTNLLRIVLTNLLSNALKFSGKTAFPRIEFGITILDEMPAYFVRDNGAGFDMNYAKNLFGAFQRMHKQSEFPGNGIGLATVQRIIFRHGGKVWAEAEKNSGATFYFTISEKK
jgi:PAS domain S-box-containing protein